MRVIFENITLSCIRARFAYIEFEDPTSVDLAKLLNGNEFMGRKIEVSKYRADRIL